MSGPWILGRWKKVLLALLTLAVIGTLWPNVRHGTGDRNIHAHLADSFLAGRLDVPEHRYDTSVYQGKYFVPFPPAPALVLLPIVAIVGVERTNPVLVAIVLSILTALVLSRILRRLAVDSAVIPWMIGAFMLGTGYWLCASLSSSVWFFAHVVSVTFMFLAIDETSGRGRGALAGLYFGMAVLSRQLMLLSILFLVFALWNNPRFADRRSRLRGQSAFLAISALFLGGYLIYNWLRFGSPVESGYSFISFSVFQRERVETHGLFHPIYVPFNLIQMFLQGFHIEFSPPVYLWPGEIRVSSFGTSMTFASPFVFVAVLARWRRTLLRTAWMSIGATLLVMSLYFNNGWVQPNTQRFALDFFPILILLVARGTERVPEPVWKAAVVYETRESPVSR
jgi:hypothetical protein